MLEFLEKIDSIEHEQVKIKSKLYELEDLKKQNELLKRELKENMKELQELKEQISKLRKSDNEEGINIKDDISFFVLQEVKEYFKNGEANESFKKEARSFLEQVKDKFISKLINEEDEIIKKAYETVENENIKYKAELNKLKESLILKFDEDFNELAKEFLKENKEEFFTNLDLSFLKYELLNNVVFKDSIKKHAQDMLNMLFENGGLKEKLENLAFKCLKKASEEYDFKKEHFLKSLDLVNLSLNTQVNSIQNALKNINELEYYEQKAKNQSLINKTYEQR